VTRWIGALSNGFRMIAGRAGVDGSVVYLVADKNLFDTYRFPGTIEEEGAGTCNGITKDIVLFHGAGPRAWCRAAASLCARLLARDAGAAPWAEEGMARYFSTLPSAGDDRLKAGKVHEASAARMKRAVKDGNFTSLWRFVLLERAEFDRKGDLHRAQAWSLVHFLRHGSGGEKDYLSGYFTRLGEGKSGRDALGSLDWGGLEAGWKSHILAISR
jgi:hypothetical protein